MRIPLNHRPALSAALAAGLAAGCLVAPWLAASTALLVAWCAAAAAHLALSLQAIARTTPEAARRRAALLDSDKWMTLGGSLAAAVASLGAIALDLASTAGERVTAGDAASATGAVALSWAFVHVLLTHHYMHEYWLGGGQGLVFPGEDRPGTGDFLYLAFTVGMIRNPGDRLLEAGGVYWWPKPIRPNWSPGGGMTCQVSDVTTASAAMRRLVLLHGLVSFLFNAVIVAAAVNVAAGVVR
jgi:uncharacterized membrane protein